MNKRKLRVLINAK